MPWNARRPCSVPGCPELSIQGHAYCEKHIDRERARRRENDYDRGTAHQRGYTAQWRIARRAFLAAHPLCVRCKEQGRLTPATVVDHIIPHRGDQRLFWDETNWQPLCKRCHDKKTASGK